MTVNEDLGDAIALLEGAKMALDRIHVDRNDDPVLAHAVTDLGLATTYAFTKAQHLVNWKREREK